jgi:hypothetical protein
LIAIKPVSYISIVPEIFDIVPIIGAVVPEIIKLSSILVRPVIPVLLAISDRLPSLG